MSHGFTQVAKDLYLFEDTCNVYAVRSGEEALLIDFGAGEVLHHLGDIGVSRVAAILHTHHHRDQAQGDAEAARLGIPIHVPVHERHLFDQEEIFWSTKQLYDMYDVRNTYFALTASVPVAGVLADYERFEWKGYGFEILPTPGHSMGSVSLVGHVGGALVAFSGDLLHSPGKVVSMYDMQYNYGAVDGVETAVLSLGLLEERKPALLCPSHGEPMRDVPAALTATGKNLRAFYRLMSGGKLLADEVDFTPVASRLLHGTQTCSSFYVILSRDGKRALFVD
jgi:glyoxylase-like metal-dependent hydrolase (beta-lactamase superfamily II)